MAVDILKPIGWLPALGNNLECNLHMFHFFLYGILLECIFILLLNGICLIDHLRQLKPKVMGHFKISSMMFSYYGDNLVPFLQNMMNPPVKCWFIFDALSHSIFGNLDWMPFLNVG